jgi:hypothetical protein
MDTMRMAIIKDLARAITNTTRNTKKTIHMEGMVKAEMGSMRVRDIGLQRSPIRREILKEIQRAIKANQDSTNPENLSSYR